MKKGRKKKPKKYKCKICKGEYEKKNSLQQWCSPSCGFKYSQKILKKKEDEERKSVKRDLRKRKELIKGKGQLTKEAQREFNRWIVQRDWFDTCICCGGTIDKEYITGSPWDAGHYLSVGAYPEKRFNADNVHKQLSSCNRFKQGDSGSYRENLIRKIGLQRVLKLESPEPPMKYTHDELREIRDYYRKEANILKKQNMEKMECK